MYINMYIYIYLHTQYTHTHPPKYLTACTWSHGPLNWDLFCFGNHNFQDPGEISTVWVYIQVVPGRAGGGSFRRKKNYIAKKEFAYRMCARRPTSAMPKPFLCCERAFCCSMVVMWPVLMHVMSFDVVVMSRDAMRCHVMCAHVMCPAMVTLCVRSGSVTMWWSKILFCTTKYYCVLQSTTPVLQSTTPVLLCTTKYYSSTTLYYTIELRFFWKWKGYEEKGTGKWPRKRNTWELSWSRKRRKHFAYPWMIIIA